MAQSLAETLFDARSTLAALADLAQTFEASSAYEHLLLHLDGIYTQRPPLDSQHLSTDRAQLYAAVAAAIESLTQFGLDPLRGEVLLAELAEARAQDAP